MENMEHKSNILKIIVIVLLVLVLGGLLFFGNLWLTKDLVEKKIDLAQDDFAQMLQALEDKIDTLTISKTKITSPIETNKTNSKTEIDEKAVWQVYENLKYNYQFSYLSNWLVNDNDTKNLILQGDVKEKGWPSIDINLTEIDVNVLNLKNLKLDLEYLFKVDNIKETSFGKNISALTYSTPEGGGAYAMTYYYFIHNQNIFKIGLNDSDELEAKTIYDKFLNSFELL